MSNDTLVNMVLALTEAIGYQVNGHLLAVDLHHIHQRLQRMEQEEAAQGVKLMAMSVSSMSAK